VRIGRALVLALALTALAGGIASAPAEAEGLRPAQVRDKVAGAWLGEVIAGAWGEPTEFRYLGRTIPAAKVPAWNARRANRYTYRGESDETYTELPFLDATLRSGPATGYPQWGGALAASQFPLFFANQRARDNLRAGIPAPLSGDPEHNHHAYDIDFQIESDWIGLALPAQPGAAADLAWRVGHVTSYGDGVYGGVMIAAMHAAAFDARSLGQVIDAGRESVPEGTTYRAMIEDVLRWHSRHPRDWRATWRRLEQRWNTHTPRAKRTRIGSEFNIDAKLNGGYVLMGLLYGNGNFERTIRITMRAGQDSDCDPSNAASILGTWLGRRGIPHRYRAGIARNRRFPFSTYTLRSAIAANLELARTLTLARGGSVAAAGWQPAPSPVAAAPFEQWDY
jgi:hypothetical protein